MPRLKPLPSAFGALLTGALLAGGALLARDSLPHPVDAPRAGTGASAQLPMYFEENRGQSDPGVRYLARGRGTTLFLTDRSAVLRLEARRGKGGGHDDGHEGAPSLLRLTLPGQTSTAPLIGESPLAGRVNYLLGGDPAAWKRNIPTCGRVRYRSVYPGVDLVYHGRQGELEHDFVVAPGADPAPIRMRWQGAQRAELALNGDLLLHTPAGALRQCKPVCYQESAGGRTLVDAAYVLSPGSDATAAEGRGERDEPREVRLALGRYDPSLPLVIDPLLVYSTYLGGTSGDNAAAVALDEVGHAYVAGSTSSVDLSGTPPNEGFPTTAGVVQPRYAGNTDAFVAKLSPDGSALVFSTYLGGSGLPSRPGSDAANAIAVDNQGNVCVAGGTSSADFAGSAGINEGFPTTPNAFQRVYAGGPADAFVARLSPDGSQLLYSSFLGGTTGNPAFGRDIAFGLALDSTGTAYVCGDTNSDQNFPATPGVLQPGWQGSLDGFVAKFDFTRSGPASLVYCTHLGAANNDSAAAIAVDDRGNACVTGSTDSVRSRTNPQSGFPVTPNGTVRFSDANRGSDPDAFVSKLNATGSALLFSTYLGGWGADGGRGIGLDPDDRGGSLFVTGYTESADRPGTAVNEAFPAVGSYQRELRGVRDAFVARFNPAAAATPLVYCTYFGGSDSDEAFAMAMTPRGRPYITGGTSSADFPVGRRVFQGVYGGAGDAFLAAFDTTRAGERSLVTSTFLGGSARDHGYGVASNIPAFGSGFVYLCGATASVNNSDTPENEGFPITPGAFQEAYGGRIDAFVMKLNGAAQYKTPFAVQAVYDPRTLVVGLTWADPNGAAQAYEIERRVDGQQFKLIATTKLGETAYTDETVKPKQIYFYRLRAIGDDGESDWTDELPLYTGEGQGKLKVTPAKLSFGPVRVGRSKIRKIRLRNTGQVPLACTVGDEIQDSFFQVDNGGGALTLKPGETRSIAIRFAPTIPGQFRLDLKVNLVAPGQSSRVVPLTGKGKKPPAR